MPSWPQTKESTLSASFFVSGTLGPENMPKDCKFLVGVGKVHRLFWPFFFHGDGRHPKFIPDVPSTAIFAICTLWLCTTPLMGWPELEEIPEAILALNVQL